MKKIIAGMLFLALNGCGSGSSTSSISPITTSTPTPIATGATIQGVDFSGTYSLAGVECFNTVGVETNSESFSGFTDTFVINGNSLSGMAATSGCSVTTSETIVFSSSASSTGATITNAEIQSATGGGCTLTKTLSGSSISPTTAISSFTTGETIANVTANYLWESPYLGIPSGYSDGAGGTCYVVFEKQ